MFIGTTFARSHIYVFDKRNMLAGGSGHFTLFSLDNADGDSQIPAIGDAHRSFLYLLQNYDGNIQGTGFLRLWWIRQRIRTNPDGSVRKVLQIQAGNFYSIKDTAWRDLPGAALGPQLGSTEKIEVGDSRIVTGVYCRRGTGYSYLYAVHAVFLPASAPTRSAIQFWCVRTDYEIDQFARIDDTNGVCFAFPSLAVTSLNNVLIGFSRFSAHDYAGANWAFRWSSDTQNTLREGGVLKSGEGPYYNISGGAENRWGDYSSTCLDTSDVHAVWTIQEYARPQVRTGNQSGRWGTWWGRFKFPVATVPDVYHRSKTEAAVIIQRAGLFPLFKATGLEGDTWVGDQSPDAGATVPKGSTVTCTLQKVPPPPP
jgi:hypothetical protein